MSIPVDLLIDIFSRDISAKSIARFRCVSKLWAQILNHPVFTELFLSKSSTRPRLLFTLEAKGKLFFYSSPRPQNLDDQNVTVVVVATCYHKYLPKYFESCECTLVRGLALLKGDCYGERTICNPATGEFLTLPKVNADIRSFYFGYDPINKQFKVLCMTSSFCGINTHMVLTLETGEPSWRTMETEFDFLVNYSIKREVCINGVLYFGGDVNQSKVIVSFDVRSEKFSFINPPEEEMIKYPTLINFKGKLGVLDDRNNYLRADVVFWVLEDAENHKWFKHVHTLSYSRKASVRRSSFWGMSCNGELVWSPERGDLNFFYLLFYNLESKTLTRVNIEGFQEFKEYRRIALNSVDYEENIIKNETWSLLTK